RADGWPGLKTRYGLPQQDVRGLAHDLAYRGVASGAIDVTDLYSTDAEIVRYGLIALEDDAHYFPVYDALFVCRTDISQAVRDTIDRLGGRIDEAAMTAMNARAKLDRVPESQVAADFLQQHFHLDGHAAQQSRSERVWKRTREHLAMVAISLGAAVLIA